MAGVPSDAADAAGACLCTYFIVADGLAWILGGKSELLKKLPQLMEATLAETEDLDADGSGGLDAANDAVGAKGKSFDLEAKV
jgi:hypothetical protein